MAEFNLLDEQWILCIDHSGKYQELSIRELLSNAHQFKQFAHSYSIVNASYFFLIEALLLRVYSDAKSKANEAASWYKLFSAGKFDDALFEAYFQKWHSRFFLFDDQHPFFQDAEYDVNAIGSAMKLMPHYSGGTGGNTSTLFDHHTEAEGIALTIKEAANFLLPAYYYGAGGRIIGRDYFSEAPTANGLSFFVGGENLFETLLLNLLPYPDGGYDVPYTENDRPIWEQDQAFSWGERHFKKEGFNTFYEPYGLIDLLTWPGRKIRLIQENDGTIRNIQMHTGLKTSQKTFPWFAYKRNGSYIRAQKERALWRNYDILLGLKNLPAEDGNKQAPYPVNWLNELIQNGYLKDRRFDLYCLGMAKLIGKQKTFFYSQQKLPLPTEYFMNQDLVSDISTELHAAEKTKRFLYGATAALSTVALSFDSDRPKGRVVDKNDINNVINHLNTEFLYWEALAPAFSEFIIQLPHNREASISTWRESIKTAAGQALEHAERLLGNSASCLKAAITANAILEKSWREGSNEIKQEEMRD